jgi:endogenous inhibitor of DNA gyrase (YacG/DUF329 family)
MGKKQNKVNKVVPLKRSKCPICGKLTLDQTKPFCSTRCSNLDLGRWLDGRYRIVTDEPPSDSDSDFAIVDDD